MFGLKRHGRGTDISRKNKLRNSRVLLFSHAIGVWLIIRYVGDDEA